MKRIGRTWHTFSLIAGCLAVAADFSKRLFDAGKTKSAVIGHTTNAGPEINGGGKTADPDQDYRFGERAIFKNGRLTELTTRKGALNEEALAK